MASSGPSSPGWVLAPCLTLALLALTSTPYLYAWVTVPDDLVYLGLMYDVPDHAQYWSWVTASRDALFISNTMTPEPNEAVFTNPMMWGLAQVQAALGLSFPALFQVWRVVAVAIFVPLLLAFVSLVVPQAPRRPLAFAIALLGAGLGWIWVGWKYVSGAADVPWPQDLYTVEPNTFFSMLSYPHLLLAEALVLATMVGALCVHKGRGWSAYVLAAGAAAVLSVSHAYDLITVYTVLGVYGLVEWRAARALPRRLAAAGVLIALVSAPTALYYQALTTGDPLWRAVLAQFANAGVWTPPHWHLVVLMGLPLVLAAVGLVPKAGWTDDRRFLAVWALSGLVLVYLPVVYQVKLLSAWQLPIAALAAHAWHERIAPAQPRLATAAACCLVAFVSLTNVYLLAWRFVELRRHASPYFLHRDQRDALDWLAAHGGDTDVVLADVGVGQFVPNYGASRSYLAHWAMTNRFFERRENVARFFDPATDEAWRRSILRADRVTLVLRSGWPDAMSVAYAPRAAQGYELVFDRPEAQIYRVGTAGGAATLEGR